MERRDFTVERSAEETQSDNADFKEHVEAEYDDFFGRGWKAAYAEALSLSTDTMTRMNPNTCVSASAFMEFFKATSSDKWPKRFVKLRMLRVQLECVETMEELMESRVATLIRQGKLR